MRDFHTPGRSAVYAENGMAATSHPLASKVAIDTLAAGGNAMDAAIAASVLLGICEPQMTGIGGDCFVLISRPGEEPLAMNGSGRAPAATNAQALRDAGHATIPVRSPDAVTIPGAIDAFCTLSADHGVLGLDQVLAPAIHYAEAGVPVAPRVAFDWAASVENLSGVARDQYLSAGAAPKLGSLFRAPGQAEVLRRIVKDGRAGFYEGEVAADMVDSLRALGGVHTLEDFAGNKPTYTTPISGTYKGTELVEHPPNGQGATAILIANILAQFDVASMDPMGADRIHLEAEATKLAYDARDRFVADPDHTARLEHMLSPETAAKLAQLIDMNTAMTGPAALAEAIHKDTVYLTVIDKDRMVVSMIYSIFHSFGSGLASDKFGILFQNRGAGFTLTEGHSNEMGAGKRPMHTIIPGLFRQGGNTVAGFGVMGGAYQPVGHARVLSNLVDFDMDLQSALDAPRAFATEGVLRVERGYGEAVRADLTRRGHSIETPHEPIGGAQAIWIDSETGTLQGASDPRKDGCALGY